MNWMTLGLYALWVAAVAQTLFVVIYGVVAPWLTSFVGRALFAKSAALAIVLDVSVVNNYATYPYQLQIATMLIVLVAVSIVYQLLALIRQRRLDHNGRRG